MLITPRHVGTLRRFPCGHRLLELGDGSRWRASGGRWWLVRPPTALHGAMLQAHTTASAEPVTAKADAPSMCCCAIPLRHTRDRHGCAACAHAYRLHTMHCLEDTPMTTPPDDTTDSRSFAPAVSHRLPPLVAECVGRDAAAENAVQQATCCTIAIDDSAAGATTSPGTCASAVRPPQGTANDGARASDARDVAATAASVRRLMALLADAHDRSDPPAVTDLTAFVDQRLHERKP